MIITRSGISNPAPCGPPLAPAHPGWGGWASIRTTSGFIRRITCIPPLRSAACRRFTPSCSNLEADVARAELVRRQRLGAPAPLHELFAARRRRRAAPARLDELVDAHVRGVRRHAACSGARCVVQPAPMRADDAHVL